MMLALPLSILGLVVLAASAALAHRAASTLLGRSNG